LPSIAIRRRRLGYRWAISRCSFFHKAFAEAIPGITAVEVDAVTTLEGDKPSTVSVTLVGSTLHFSFGIPRGNDGAAGENGATGPQGETGAQGEPGPTGEVSQAEFEGAIAGTSANINSIATLDDGMSDPENEALRQKLIEVILGLRR
jgi:hypothetical protein